MRIFHVRRNNYMASIASLASVSNLLVLGNGAGIAASDTATRGDNTLTCHLEKTESSGSSICRNLVRPCTWRCSTAGRRRLLHRGTHRVFLLSPCPFRTLAKRFPLPISSSSETETRRGKRNAFRFSPDSGSRVNPRISGSSSASDWGHLISERFSNSSVR